VPERIKITVRPSGAHPDVLTIEDAMRQVLDIFEMLEDAPGVEWKLVTASTNSPLQVVAEAISFESSVDVTVVARTQKQNLAKSLREIARGESPSDPAFKTNIAKRLLSRNLNGVGATELDFEIGEPIVVTPRVAEEAIAALGKKPSEFFDRVVTREEVGSIEGTLSYVGTHYNRPAVRIVAAHGQGAIWCWLSDELQAEFQDKATYRDVWQHRRVFIRGRIKYGKDGEIEYVIATDIRRIDTREVSVEALKDPNFTSGLSVGEYIVRFRDGTLG
jgi:hypothetical protein